MQDIRSNLLSGINEINDAFITGVNGLAQRFGFWISSVLNALVCRINKTFFLPHTDLLLSRHEVVIMYFGRTSELLMMTSERMVIPSGHYTLGQLLCRLYKRGNLWVDELDDSNLLCTVNGRDGCLFDTIVPGSEICISSKKSIFAG